MRLYRTPVGTFWGRSAMGWSGPFSLGEFLVEGPLLARLLPIGFLRPPNLPPVDPKPAVKCRS